MTVVVNSIPEPVPSRADPANFPARADAAMLALPAMFLGMNEQNVENNSINSSINTKYTEASTSAATAATAASTAAATSTAANWVSGTTYAVDNVRRSLIDGLAYRRLTAGAGTTDPKNDPTNWVLDFLLFDSGLPDLRPTLLLDFANSSVVDSRIAFTRASEAAYFDSRGVIRFAPSGVPRTTHDPIQGTRWGLLVEREATNTVLNSADITQASWTTTQLTKTGGFAAPDGSTTAVKLTDTVVAGNHQLSIITQAVLAGIKYLASYIVKAGERTKCSLVFVTSTIWPSNVNPAATFDLVAGTISGITGPSTKAGMQQLLDGWWRVWVSADCSVNGGSYCALLLSNGAATSYTGDGVSGLYVWHGQMETGLEVPSSPIKTTGTAATRLADSITIAGSNFTDFYSQPQGTWVVDFVKTTDPTKITEFFRIDDGTGTTTNRLSVNSAATGKQVVVAYGVDGSVTTTTNYEYGDRVRVAASYIAGRLAVSINGSMNNTTDASVSAAAVPTTLRIGHGQGTGNAAINGTVKLAAYYPRNCTDAELMALSRL